MPTLYRYVPSAEKSGFYIRANVGLDHPITLQVTDLGRQILQAIDYGSGDTVPTKVVWSMYEVGLMRTGSNLNQVREVEEAGAVLNDLGLSSKLSESTRQRLIEYLDDYEGPSQEQIDELRQDLIRARIPSESSDLGAGGDETLPETIDEAVSHLFICAADSQQWLAFTRRLDYHPEHVYVSVRVCIQHPLAKSDTISVPTVGKVRCDIADVQSDIYGEIIFNNFSSSEESIQVRVEIDNIERSLILEYNDQGEIMHYGKHRTMSPERAGDEFLIPNTVVRQACEVLDLYIKDYSNYHTAANSPSDAIRVDHNGEKYNVSKYPVNVGNDKLLCKVDRISGSGNPVVKQAHGHILLDRGEPGCVYLVDYSSNSNKRGRVISQLSE